ncbi:hypothetical protein CFAM422_006847 [Trichoderma lentiforme]|uniref:Uncharacterized protein n=1 Tax=Trichoderma lentiforme TaxID=1567552 RepID=A0A9P5CD55_9HYPO|nr:hypothetical protein CFAM422_006847 [Trichoderma lentiforme]
MYCPIPSSRDEDNTPQPSTQPLLQSLSEGPHYSAKHLLDLRLMHQYSVFTVQSFEAVWRNERVSDAMLREIPQLALEHEFLMDTVLLVAMIHLAYTDPVSRESLPIYLYRDQALRSFRQAVASISTQNISAHSGIWVTNWLALAVGQRNFPSNGRLYGLSSSQPDSRFTGSLYGSFSDISLPAAVLPQVQDILPKEESDCDWGQRGTLYEVAASLGTLIAILGEPHEQLWLEKKIKAWAFDVVPSEFLEMVQWGNHRALLILAYYLVLLNLLPATWIYQDVAGHDMAIIEESVGVEWRKYISIPKMAMQLDDKVSIARLLTNNSQG